MILSQTGGGFLATRYLNSIYFPSIREAGVDTGAMHGNWNNSWLYLGERLHSLLLGILWLHDKTGYLCHLCYCCRRRLTYPRITSNSYPNIIMSTGMLCSALTGDSLFLSVLFLLWYHPVCSTILSGHLQVTVRIFGGGGALDLKITCPTQGTKKIGLVINLWILFPIRGTKPYLAIISIIIFLGDRALRIDYRTRHTALGKKWKTRSCGNRFDVGFLAQSDPVRRYCEPSGHASWSALTALPAQWRSNEHVLTSPAALLFPSSHLISSVPCSTLSYLVWVRGLDGFNI